MIFRYIYIYLLFLNLANASEYIDVFSKVNIYDERVSAYISLYKPIEDFYVADKNETQLYKYFIHNINKPDTVIAEIIAHPISIVGVYLKSRQPKLYNNFKVGNFYPLQSLTSGIDSPYEFSVSFGKMILFEKSRDKNERNRAFVGSSVSFSNISLKDNSAYFNRWFRFGFRTMGVKTKKDNYLKIDLNFGKQINSNRNFSNTYFFKIVRKSIDYDKTIYSFKRNSIYSCSVELNDRFDLSRFEILYGKYFPITSPTKFAFSLSLGFAYNGMNKYSNTLSSDDKPYSQMILQPNFTF